MPRKTQINKKRTRIIIIGSVVVILAALSFLVYRKYGDTKVSVSPSPAPTTQTTSSPGSASAQENPKDATPTPVPTAQPGGGKQSLVPNISNYNGGDPVTVNAVLGKSGAGTCTITFSRAGQRDVVRSAQAGLVVSYYGCGFSVPRSVFPVGGNWSFTVKFENSTYAGESTPMTIDIK